MLPSASPLKILLEMIVSGSVGSDISAKVSEISSPFLLVHIQHSFVLVLPTSVSKTVCPNNSGLRSFCQPATFAGSLYLLDIPAVNSLQKCFYFLDILLKVLFLAFCLFRVGENPDMSVGDFFPGDS